MAQMQAIHLFLPNTTSKQQEDIQVFTPILSQLRNMKKVRNGLASALDPDLLPVSRMLFADVSVPKIMFETPSVDLSFSPKLDFEAPKSRALISLSEVREKLDGKLIGLNHWGLNIGPQFMSYEDYLQFRTTIAQHANLYRYPGAEEWSFVIPATAEEYKIDITDTTRKRNPKFEVVYYEHQQRPLLQFDIDTILTKQEAMDLFPDPVGISYSGLEDYFRTVFVPVDWGGWECRIDVSFRSQKELDFGYWMIKEGGRIIEES